MTNVKFPNSDSCFQHELFACASTEISNRAQDNLWKKLKKMSLIVDIYVECNIQDILPQYVWWITYW